MPRCNKKNVSRVETTVNALMLYKKKKRKKKKKKKIHVDYFWDFLFFNDSLPYFFSSFIFPLL